MGKRNNQEFSAPFIAADSMGVPLKCVGIGIAIDICCQVEGDTNVFFY